MIVVLFLLIGICTLMSDYYITDNLAYDWFYSKSVDLYTIFNFTYIRIIENFLLIFGVYIHRNYPRELNISQEMIIVLIFNWTLAAYYEFLPHVDPFKEGCVFIYNWFSFGEIVRSCLFIVTLYLLTYNSTTTFPLPFSWVFNDISKFIFEPSCLEVYMRYLEVKDPAGNVSI